MGKATNDRSSQMIYLQNRIQMLQQVIESMDGETADPSDLDRLLSMIEDLRLKVERYKKDWEEGRS
ncbi:SE1561 family protein [Pontibacillus marinus]|uniref:Uncharacterized protein n=1 Tax=Pontibacillus marinus BH030004 = DSM 16465 TaxID=1385511 RepID=A0A0A5G8B0_9BACI|nr:SE1561 family protein [Pontibacillus marinus]KGX88289.1 hypothetical protein N783_08515 [Pontibacillus marinus BH030004 = DSM 16465]